MAALATRTPLLPGADRVAFIDGDPTHKRVYGRPKQGAQIGRFKGVRPFFATLSTPITRPVIASVRIRRDKAADVRRTSGHLGRREAVSTAAGRHADHQSGGCPM
jgi:hypothetical protein